MKKIKLLPIAIGAVTIALSFILFPKDLANYRNLVVVFALISMTTPTVIFYALEIKKQKEKDQKFLEFIRDVVEGVKSGTPVSRAIINLKERDYGALNPHVEKISNQISMGIPLTSALETFALDTKSSLIIRSVSLVSEANRSGGEINTILNSVVSSVNQTETIQKERRASIFNLIVQGYIIFLVFIIIILVLEFFLMPLIDGLGPIKDLNNVGISPSDSDKDFTQPIFFLLITQSLFSGLVIGKLAEGKIVAGIKHSFILVSLALLLFSIATLIFGG